MSERTKQVEQVDHGKRSREWLDQAEARAISEAVQTRTDLALAQVHATLALTDEVRQLRIETGLRNA